MTHSNQRLAGTPVVQVTNSCMDSRTTDKEDRRTQSPLKQEGKMNEALKI